MQPERTSECMTAGEFQELIIKTYRDGGSEEDLKRTEKHVLQCAYCRNLWATEQAVEKLAGKVSLDTLRKKYDLLEPLSEADVDHRMIGLKGYGWRREEGAMVSDVLFETRYQLASFVSVVVMFAETGNCDLDFKVAGTKMTLVMRARSEAGMSFWSRKDFDFILNIMGVVALFKSQPPPTST